MLNHFFTTPVLRRATGLAPEELREVSSYILSLRAADPGESRSNRGGWHSVGNLFDPAHRAFPAMNEAVTSALFSYIADAFGYSGEIQIALTGWSIVNGPGDYNVIHNHAANLLSGALYITVPADMQGGAIHFHDPRLNLNAHETEAMRKLGLRPPWLATSVAIEPVAGEILVFPSWLNHWVEPFHSASPDALRIVVSFNATVV
jgi:uncharacterized protein (TIGR02466 family)